MGLEEASSMTLFLKPYSSALRSTERYRLLTAASASRKWSRATLEVVKALLATEAEAIDLERRSVEDILVVRVKERGSNLESWFI
jgi:hypothetical protein